MRQPGVGIQGVDRLCQVTRAHDERRAGKTRRDGGPHGVGAAVRIDDVEAPAPQHPPYEHHATEEIERPVHGDDVHGETGLAQTLSQLGTRLAHGFQMVPALAHGDHLLEDAELLAAVCRRGFGVQDAQAPAGPGGAGLRVNGTQHDRRKWSNGMAAGRQTARLRPLTNQVQKMPTGETGRNWLDIDSLRAECNRKARGHSGRGSLGNSKSIRLTEN
ncbi:hypothetical protein D3C72_1617960 [compost metagenome]